MKSLFEIMIAAAVVLLSANACNRGGESVDNIHQSSLMTKREVARMLSSLPIGSGQMGEVYDAVSSSSANGYDEEYMMLDLLTIPGAGVGDDRTKAVKASSAYSVPMKTLIADYLAGKASASTKSGAADVQRYLDDLRDSGMQISREWCRIELCLCNWFGSKRIRSAGFDFRGRNHRAGTPCMGYKSE